MALRAGGGFPRLDPANEMIPVKAVVSLRLSARNQRGPGRKAMGKNRVTIAAGGGLRGTFKRRSMTICCGTADLGIAVGHGTVLGRGAPAFGVRITGVTGITGNPGASPSQIGAVAPLARGRHTVLRQDIFAVTGKTFPTGGMGKHRMAGGTGNARQPPSEIGPMALGGASGRSLIDHEGPVFLPQSPVDLMGILLVALVTGNAAPSAAEILPMTPFTEDFIGAGGDHPVLSRGNPLVGVRIDIMAQIAGDVGKTPAKIGPVALCGAASPPLPQNKGAVIFLFHPVGRMRIKRMAGSAGRSAVNRTAGMALLADGRAPKSHPPAVHRRLRPVFGMGKQSGKRGADPGGSRSKCLGRGRFRLSATGKGKKEERKKEKKRDTRNAPAAEGK